MPFRENVGNGQQVNFNLIHGSIHKGIIWLQIVTGATTPPSHSNSTIPDQHRLVPSKVCNRDDKVGILRRRAHEEFCLDFANHWQVFYEEASVKHHDIIAAISLCEVGATAMSNFTVDWKIVSTEHRSLAIFGCRIIGV